LTASTPNLFGLKLAHRNLENNYLSHTSLIYFPYDLTIHHLPENTLSYYHNHTYDYHSLAPTTMLNASFLMCLFIRPKIDGAISLYAPSQT